MVFAAVRTHLARKNTRMFISTAYLVTEKEITQMWPSGLEYVCGLVVRCWPVLPAEPSLKLT